ncbi:hypothetical protein A0H81_12811 [Grifola frondosa]|uniref:GRF-type domain-containing protein n=1 Tax=Grifola frondosa TaxID=5627 RepID=A0A1C7LR40_GRIFR|nr:hypothetical protein A0H81_12811 [Grifola frondosa]
MIFMADKRYIRGSGGGQRGIAKTEQRPDDAGSSQTFTHRSSCVDEEGNVRCYQHGELAARHTSRTITNPERDFYSCAKSMDDPDRCKFFKWVDEIEVHPPNPQPAPPSLPGNISSRPSQQQRAALARTSSTSAINPQKRPRAITPPPASVPGPAHPTPQAAVTPSHTITPSQRERRREGHASSQGSSRRDNLRTSSTSFSRTPSRLKVIEAALAASQAEIRDLSDELRSASSPPPSPKRSRLEINEYGSNSPRNTTNHSDAPVQTDSIPDEDESSWPQLDSISDAEEEFWHPSKPIAGPSREYHLADVPQEPWTPRTPERSAPARAYTPSGSVNANGMLMTPPQSSQPLERDFGAGPVLSLGASESQWQRIVHDPEHPFHERALALRMGSQTGSQESVHAELPSTDSIAEHIAALSDIPDFVRKLERKQKAAQKSNEIKSKRIAELEQEIQRLQNKNRALEETVSALRTRRR